MSFRNRNWELFGSLLASFCIIATILGGIFWIGYSAGYAAAPVAPEVRCPDPQHGERLRSMTNKECFYLQGYGRAVRKGKVV